jgi:hypothetical protein
MASKCHTQALLANRSARKRTGAQAHQTCFPFHPELMPRSKKRLPGIICAPLTIWCLGSTASLLHVAMCNSWHSFFLRFQLIRYILQKFNDAIQHLPRCHQKRATTRCTPATTVSQVSVVWVGRWVWPPPARARECGG